MFDTGIGPIAFVTVNALAGLETAAAAAVGLSVLVGIERLVRRKPVTNALGGVIGTGIAVFIALRSGSAEGYFVPRMLYAAALALVFAGSVAIRRPLVGYLVGALWRAPSEWIADPLVRRAFSEVTLAWSALFAFRATVYAVLIAAGKAGWLAAASIAMGWPAFLLLLYASYRYLPRRLAQLGAPERPDRTEPPARPAPPRAPTPSRGGRRRSRSPRRRCRRVPGSGATIRAGPRADRHAVGGQHGQRPLGQRDLAERGRVDVIGHDEVARAEVAQVQAAARRPRARSASIAALPSGSSRRAGGRGRAAASRSARGRSARPGTPALRRGRARRRRRRSPARGRR